MNDKDKNPDHKKIYRFIKERFEKTTHFRHGPFDETYFTLRVFESCKTLIKTLKKDQNNSASKKSGKKPDENIILTAALLHDIGKTRLKTSKIFDKKNIAENFSEEWHRHASLSVPIARRFLKTLGHSKDFIKKVCYLIKNHDQRNDKLKEKSINLMVLQDADLIADCGFAGFIRPFLFSGKFNHQSIIGSIRYLQQEENRVEKENWLNLDISVRMAEDKMKLQKKLVKEISKDINSEILD